MTSRLKESNRLKSSYPAESTRTRKRRRTRRSLKKLMKKRRRKSIHKMRKGSWKRYRKTRSKLIWTVSTKETLGKVMRPTLLRGSY